MPKYIAPRPGADPMTCPLCETLAEQDWRTVYNVPSWSNGDKADHFRKVENVRK